MSATAHVFWAGAPVGWGGGVVVQAVICPPLMWFPLRPIPHICKMPGWGASLSLGFNILVQRETGLGPWPHPYHRPKAWALVVHTGGCCDQPATTKSLHQSHHSPCTHISAPWQMLCKPNNNTTKSKLKYKLRNSTQMHLIQLSTLHIFPSLYC